MDADREVVLRTLFLQFVENALHHRRGKFLGGQSVPSADNSREALEWQGSCRQTLLNCGDYILVQRLSNATGLLRPIEHSDRLNRRRDRLQEVLHREWAEQANFDHADLFALRNQI